MSPMCETSKIPAPVRTALCSAIIPPAEGYSTGMSQPLNSTIFAPICRCTAFSAVFRMADVVTSTADKFSSVQGRWAAVDGETHYPNMQAARAATAGSQTNVKPHRPRRLTIFAHLRSLFGDKLKILFCFVERNFGFGIFPTHGKPAAIALGIERYGEVLHCARRLPCLHVSAQQVIAL